MKNWQKFILLFCIIGICTGLNACGRYSEPSPIEGSNFPHQYPQH